jgi:glycolate oxidase FAD binding subunit
VPAALEKMPLSDTLTPADQAELAHIVSDAFAEGTPVYPLGGGTSMGFGLPARDSGWGVSLGALKQVIDYPARDMTITVEAGITLDTLAKTLAKEGQRLPIDLPDAHRATLGGIIATNTSGARRLSNGTLRDYVIGIRAVDGRGTTYNGGGRVVKNVAGYDFCKLLTGSLGTLGIITQVTLKVKPIPPCSRFVACRVRDFPAAERLLAELAASKVPATAVELLAGEVWNHDSFLGSLADRGKAYVVAGLEGMHEEVDWMAATLWNEWRRMGIAGEIVPDHQTSGLWMRLAQFPAHGNSPLVVKAALRPSKTVDFISLVDRLDPNAAIQSHAASGIVIIRFSDLPMAELSKILIGQLQPGATEHDGHVTVLSCATPTELTRQCWWGSLGDSATIMEEVKRQFDPKDILNRGRFVYAGM